MWQSMYHITGPEEKIIFSGEGHYDKNLLNCCRNFWPWLKCKSCCQTLIFQKLTPKIWTFSKIFLILFPLTQNLYWYSYLLKLKFCSNTNGSKLNASTMTFKVKKRKLPKSLIIETSHRNGHWQKQPNNRSNIQLMILIFCIRQIYQKKF